MGNLISMRDLGLDMGGMFSDRELWLIGEEWLVKKKHRSIRGRHHDDRRAVVKAVSDLYFACRKTEVTRRGGGCKLTGRRIEELKARKMAATFDRPARMISGGNVLEG